MRDPFIDDTDEPETDLACAPDDGITLAEFHERHETRIVEMQQKYGAMNLQQADLDRRLQTRQGKSAGGRR